MYDNELISIIVPVYNSVSTLSRCLDSLIHQTYSSVEILLINDGSTDGSDKVCSEYMRKYPNIILINQYNKGVSSARNAGLNHSNGEYIVFIDSDDFLHEKFLEIMVDSVKKNHAKIAICKHLTMSNPLVNLSHTKPNIKILVQNSRDTLRDLLYNKNKAPYCWGKLWARSVLKNTYFYNYIFCEDALFTIEILAQYSGPVVVLGGTPLYYYCQGSTSVTKNLSASHLMDSLSVAIKAINVVENKKKELKVCAECYAVNNAFFAYFHAPNTTETITTKSKAMSIITKYRINVLHDHNAPMKTKCALLLSFMSMSLVQKVYQIYKGV